MTKGELEKILSVITPENVRLGHTWLRRKIIEIVKKENDK